MDAPDPITSTRSLILDLPPSCAQFCPAHPKYLVVGTYNLQRDDNPGDAAQEPREPQEPQEPLAEDERPVAPKPQSRNGTLVVFNVDGDELTKVQTVLQPSALLDLRFHREAPVCQDILAVASSTGTLAIFRLDPLNDAAPLQHLATSRCEDLAEDVLFLQCNWHPIAQKVIGVTTSTGLARLLHLDDKWQIQSWTELDVHNSLEAWCIAFSPGGARSDGQNTSGSVYCGGDDSALRYASCSWGADNDPSAFGTPYGPMTVKGQHDAGVTAILPLPLTAQNGGRIVVTGSYDDRLRVFAIHDLHESHGLKRTQLLAEENLGGGVWRLDLVDTRATDSGSARIRILASCMHAGARIVEIATANGQDWTCKVLARFEEHKSMNYASDVAASSASSAAGGDGLRVVSTSFYDKLLCLWEYDPRPWPGI